MAFPYEDNDQTNVMIRSPNVIRDGHVEMESSQQSDASDDGGDV